MTGPWRAVEDELERTRDAGRTIRIWLRDDDAVTVTEPLERLRDLCTVVRMPVLLAVIPAPAEGSLGAWLDAAPSFTPCQHGYAHANHAAPGARACELGGDRPLAEVLEDLARGRQRLQRIFGARLCDVLVPPWNRIDPGLIPHLPALGFKTLSTFGPPAEADGIRHLNCDLDIIDWRNGRVGRSTQHLLERLAPLAARSRETGQPIGILTHHLAHDARAWSALSELLEGLARHPCVAFAEAKDFARA